MNISFKQILPLEWNYCLKHLIDFCSYEKPSWAKQIKSSDNKVYFLDMPAYCNLGDQAIAFAMRNFMQEVLPDYKQYEITEDKLPRCLRWLKKNIKEKDIICLTGGGNMGVEYQRYEAVRRLIMKNFKKNLIIVFPQTYDYPNTAYGKREQKRAKAIYGKVSKLLLSAREENSYNLMKKNFSNAKIVLCPDIVLFLNYLTIGKHDQEKALCLREDKESILNAKEKSELQKHFYPFNKISTMAEDIGIINEKNRKQILEQFFAKIASSKLLITDRLHGMIFAFITNTPCIALSNKNKKVKYVFDKWLKGKGNARYMDKIGVFPEIEQNKINELPIEKFDIWRQAICAYAKKNDRLC